MPKFETLFAATPPSQNNFGPAQDLNLQLAATPGSDGRTWNWVCFVRIKAGKAVQYAFQFSADNENEIILHNYPGWGRISLPRINNADFQLPGHSWKYTNNTSSDVYHALTGWHKNSPPDGDEPWWQSPMYFDNSNASKVVVGFADNWYNPPFKNAKVIIDRSSEEDCIPLYQDQIA